MVKATTLKPCHTNPHVFQLPVVLIRPLDGATKHEPLRSMIPEDFLNGYRWDVNSWIMISMEYLWST